MSDVIREESRLVESVQTSQKLLDESPFVINAMERIFLSAPIYEVFSNDTSRSILHLKCLLIQKPDS